MKKILSYILIAVGASDLILWVINGLSFGWLEFVVGVNVISRYGPWLLILGGVWLLRREQAIDKSEVDAVSDFEPGEDIIFKHIGNSTIVMLTSKRILYRSFNLQDSVYKNHNNVLADEKVSIYYSDINSVKAIRVKDIAKNAIGKLSGFEFGVSLSMKDGAEINIYTGKSHLIAAHISKLLKK